jgi:hypothetical protein
MADEQTIKFFEGVLSKTRDGRIPWKPTAEEANFIAAIGGQYVLSISASDEEDSWEKKIRRHYALMLRDRDDVELTTVSDTDEGISFDDVEELYKTARRKALNVDEKIGGVLEVLNRL